MSGYLICMRVNDAYLMAAGSTSDAKCAKCGCLVLVAPSSKRALTADPDMQAICTHCMSDLPMEDMEMEISEGGLQELCRPPAPNTWRDRN